MVRDRVQQLVSPKSSPDDWVASLRAAKAKYQL